MLDKAISVSVFQFFFTLSCTVDAVFFSGKATEVVISVHSIYLPSETTVWCIEISKYIHIYEIKRIRYVSYIGTVVDTADLEILSDEI
jgi:hypothetical protein